MRRSHSRFPGMRSPVVVALGFGLALTACGVPTSSPSRPIDPDAIPEQFTATTAPPTTLPPSTSTSLVPPPSTTTTTSLPVEQVEVFLVSGNRVVPIPRLLLSPASAPQVVAALVEGVPDIDEAAGLRSALPIGLTIDVTVERGVATVDLDPAFLLIVSGSEQRLAIAQIVLTLTRQAGIGQVSFTSDSQPINVPRGGGDLTAPGELVACDDYDNLLPVGFSC